MVPNGEGAETEENEAEAETTLPVQGVDDPQDTKGSDAGPNAAVTTAAADGQAGTAQLTSDALDTVPGMRSPKRVIKACLGRRRMARGRKRRRTRTRTRRTRRRTTTTAATGHMPATKFAKPPKRPQ